MTHTWCTMGPWRLASANSAPPSSQGPRSAPPGFICPQGVEAHTSWSRPQDGWPVQPLRFVLDAAVVVAPPPPFCQSSNPPSGATCVPHSLPECLAVTPRQEALLLARPMCSDLDCQLGKVRAHLFHHDSVRILPGA